VKIVNYYSTLSDDREKSNYRSDITQLFHDINSTLRRLSENLKDCDSVLIDSIGRLLFNINDLIIDLYGHSDFSDQQSEFINRLSWNIHLPTWFAHHAEKFDAGSMRFYTLTDSIAKTGILAIEKLKNTGLAITCVEALYNLTKSALEKSAGSYGYDEPRVLQKACYLGILALKKGWKEVVTEVGLKIYEFEPLFFTKYLTKIPAGIDPENHNVIGLPHSDQLLRELWRWREDFDREKLNGVLRIRDDAEALMYGLIDVIDIDRFTFEIWGTFLSDTEFEEELNLKLARENLFKTLKRIKTKS
jgi:hypothetical protein